MLARMIPPFNHSHVLPPFIGSDPTAAAQGSPFRASMLELAERFSHQAARRRLIGGLLNYRAALAALGFVRGFQWLDGSFAEDVEASQHRSPNDIDMVTFVYGPDGLGSAEISELLDAHPEVFVAQRAREVFGCDAFVVPLGKSAERLVERTAYYFNLFSHRRGDHVWKGILQIPLESDDSKARELLENTRSGDPNVAT